MLIGAAPLLLPVAEGLVVALDNTLDPPEVTDTPEEAEPLADAPLEEEEGGAVEEAAPEDALPTSIEK